MHSFVRTLTQRWFLYTAPIGSKTDPVYARERLRKARLLSMALFVLLFIAGFSLIITLFTGEIRGTPIDVIAVILVLGVARLNQQGRLHLAGLIFILGYMIACSFGLLLADLTNNVSIAYAWIDLAVVPLFAGFVLPYWTPLLFGLLDVGVIVLIYSHIFQQQTSWYFRDRADQVSLFAIATCIMLSFAALTSIYARSVENAVIEADRAIELEQMNGELAQAHQQLTTAYARLEDLATHDPVTSLLNHRALHQRLQVEVEESAKRTAQPVSLIFADLDHFKHVNDTWGHQVGDIVLRHLADSLRTNIRPHDIVGRYGGEEFVVVLPECPQADALQMAERLRVIIHQSPISLPDGRQITISISMGVATFPDDGHTVEDCIAAADTAMYQAKRAGRNCVFLATPAPQTNAA